MTISRKTSYKKYKRQQAKFSQNKAYARKKSSRQKKKKGSMSTIDKVKYSYLNSVWSLKRKLGLNHSNSGT